MADKRKTGNLMQDFGHGRFHAGTLTGSEDDGQAGSGSHINSVFHNWQRGLIYQNHFKGETYRFIYLEHISLNLDQFRMKLCSHFKVLERPLRAKYGTRRSKTRQAR
jgi:hypothetical protein